VFISRYYVVSFTVKGRSYYNIVIGVFFYSFELRRNVNYFGNSIYNSQETNYVIFVGIFSYSRVFCNLAKFFEYAF